MQGFKTYRHEQNPKEKELHDKFIEKHGGNLMSMIVYPPKETGAYPSEYLTEKEESIVISTIQWLGTPVGKKFMESCGYILLDKKVGELQTSSHRIIVILKWFDLLGLILKVAKEDKPYITHVAYVHPTEG